MGPHAAVGCAAAATLAFQFLAGACGGGGGGETATEERIGPGPSGGPLRPALRIERGRDGAAFLRITEQSFSPFDAGGPARTISNQHFGPAPGSNNVIEGAASTLIADVVVEQMKHGLTLQQSGTVLITDYTYAGFAGGGSIFGAAIKLGDNGRPTDGPTYVQRAVADGMQSPDATYRISNTDFLGIEGDSGPVYVRDVSARNFGDADVDSKSSQIYIMNATFENAHRVLRAWPGVEIVLVNVIVNAAPDHPQVWIYDGTATIRYFNTLWCLNAEAPSATNPDCRPAPWIVESDIAPAAVVAARFIPLASNPLPAASPFFRTAIDEIVAEYSRDGGNSWLALPLVNAGRSGSPPVGDTRYRIPLNLDDAAFLFRARYRLNGASVGEISAVIGED